MRPGWPLGFGSSTASASSLPLVSLTLAIRHIAGSHFQVASLDFRLQCALTLPGDPGFPAAIDLSCFQEPWVDVFSGERDHLTTGG